MGNAVPIVSVVAGAAVAILVPLISAAAQSGENRREHRRRRLARVREVLEKCCFELDDASTAAVNAARDLGIIWPIDGAAPDSEHTESPYAHFRRRLKSLYRTSLVLGLELGPDHTVCQAFDKAANSLVALQGPMGKMSAKKDNEDLAGTIHQDLLDYFETATDFHREASYLLIRQEQSGERLFPSIRGRMLSLLRTKSSRREQSLP